MEQPNVNNEHLIDKYSDVFEGFCCLPGDYHIEFDPTVTPVKHCPRRIPLSLKSELKTALDNMEKKEVIACVSQPTDWINSMVTVKKPGKLKIC